MPAIQITDTVAEVVTRCPSLSRLFEQEGIDYCCGGKKTLDVVCEKKGLDATEFVSRLEELANCGLNENVVDADAMSLTELADHIEQTHHAYLRSEFPRLEKMTKRVASVHGEKNPALLEIRDTYAAMSEELLNHLAKEEQILFPMVRQIDASETAPQFHCGSLANPIHQMELEHSEAGSALEKLRELTDDYIPPQWACNTYRAMFDALAELERDLHQHIHKENNILFPRAIKMESEKSL